MGFAFIQYDAAEYSEDYYDCYKPLTDDELRAFLWYPQRDVYHESDRWPVFGAACFRSGQSTQGKRWYLDWVWMHPTERRQGHLTRAFAFFESMFGKLGYTPPLSPDMLAFAKTYYRVSGLASGRQ
jgi:hypothetical protein